MMVRIFALAALAAAGFLACGGSTASVDGRSGATNEQLQTKKDGTATCNGATCSWDGTALADRFAANGATYAVGAGFPSLDGCNTCDCTAQGIMCTVKACGGSSSSSSSGGVACPDIAERCPDGSYVSPTGPNCTMPACPTTTASDAGVACPAIAKQCPDGSYVGPTGPNCEFNCPVVDPLPCTTIAQSASNDVDAVLQQNLACNTDSDCTTVSMASDCFSECSRAIAKSGVDAFNAEVKKVDTAQCTQFESQSCKLTVPPCVAPQTPHCINKTCQ